MFLETFLVYMVKSGCLGSPSGLTVITAKQKYEKDKKTTGFTYRWERLHVKRIFLKNRKGMSIVISTVIIVAISITMAIAVAFWAMGIGNSLTKFEKLEFVSIYADTPTQVMFSQGTQAQATAILTGDAVTNVQIVSGGSGYSSLSPPVITFVPLGGVGSGATAIATVRGGTIISITVTNGGSGYTSPPTVQIATPPAAVVSCFPVYIQLKNTGSAAATINNVFLNGKPYSAYSYIGQTGGQNLVNTVLNVGVRNNNFRINLPVASSATAAIPWSSGDYVEVEVETAAGRTYSSTVLIP